MLASIQKRLYKRSGLHFLLVMLFVGFFIFLRSFDLVVLQPYFGEGKSSRSVSFVRSAALADLDYYLQHSYIPADQEMEVLEEEKDDHQPVDTFSPGHSVVYAFDLEVYSRVLENRRQQLGLSLHKRPSVPYFILFHCWKSFLS